MRDVVLALIDRISTWWRNLDLRSPKVGRQSLLLMAAVVLVIVSVVFLLRSGEDDAPPDDQFIGFYCADCAHYFELSHAEFERLWDRRDYEAGERAGAMKFRCPHCGVIRAVRATGPPTQSETTPDPVKPPE